MTERRRARVAHVGPDARNDGGMSAVIRDLLASPLAERHALESIATWRGFGPLDRLIAFLTGIVRLAAWSLTPGPRIVHVHTAVRGSLYRKSVCILIAKLARRPVVVQLHAGPQDIADFAASIGPVRRAWFGASLRAADRLLSVSSAGGRALADAFGELDVTVVPNAAPVVDGAVAARHTDDGPELLYLGGFQDPAKGGAVLVAAVPRLLERCPELTIRLAGPGAAPPALERLTAGDPRVRWTGWLDEPRKREALACSELFVLPSLSEGLPVALLEAMAWGRGIVASAVGGVPDVLTDGVDAALVPPGDTEALTAAVARLAGDPAERRRLGAAARDRAARLNEHDVCDRIDAVYLELLAKDR